MKYSLEDVTRPLAPGVAADRSVKAKGRSAADSRTPTQSHLSEPTSSEFLLVCTAQSLTLDSGTWSFSLESVDGQSVLEASDEEFGDLNRLSLLAAVRGLEAIDGSSAVTLLSHNRYLIRSLSDSLPRWRQNNFVWEHFGRRIDVQHADLWRRVDHALAIHRVEACLVSSRLVSNGKADAARGLRVMPSANVAESSNDSVQWRIDGAHGKGVPAPSGRSSRREQAAPSDNLRRWLLGGAASSRHVSRGQRFTAADLMETA
ncbi:ribonuclease H family protein [Rubripirellula amarantea]|uniref:ribonuclease HI n=1 Tax=Rubripirellula amarantea TaxID=2527999 RepID=UPI001A9492AC|nr:ribonuclease HI [Rubripirellula amarantea]